MDDPKILDYIPGGLIVKQTKISCDFSLVSLQGLVTEYVVEFNARPWFAILGIQDIAYRREIDEILSELEITPKWFAEITDDSWAIFGKAGSIYSQGA